MTKEKSQFADDSDTAKEALDGNEEFMQNFSEEERKKAVRKVDWRLCPTLMLLYTFAYLDRANIGNAKIEGLEKTLSMTGNQYNIATSIFFAPYVVFELPSNYVLKRYFNKRPSLWIGFLCLSWGLVMTLTGVVQNYDGLIATRFFLGMAEAGFFPGAVLLCSNWYLKSELQQRISIFYIASSLSGALSGLLAFGIAKMDGIGGLEGRSSKIVTNAYLLSILSCLYEKWRWIFLLEGIASFIMGVITLLVLPDTPEQSGKWLNEDEIRYLNYRMTVQDMGQSVTAESEFNWKLFKSVILDWRIYVCGMVFWASAGPTYGLKFTLPEIITTMGFKSANAQLLTIPPYFVGGLSAWIVSRFADKFTWRMPFLVGPQMVELTGFAILCGLAAKIKDNIPACYFAVCMANAGIYPITPGINAWTANNLSGAAKRSLGIGYFAAIGNIGGIFGSYMYKADEKPRYPTGFGLSLALALWGAICSLGLEYYYWRSNKKREEMTNEEIHSKYSEKELIELGDKSPLFRYTL